MTIKKSIEIKEHSPMHESRDIDTSKKNTPDIKIDLSNADVTSLSRGD